MRWLLGVALVAGCGGSEPCDARLTAIALSDGAALDCGSAEPYGPTVLEATERDVACMIDAVLRGEPFRGVWLVECELDVCVWEGRAFDGDTLYLLHQSVLDTAPGTGHVTVLACEPDVDVRTVTTPGGPVERRELECGRLIEQREIAPPDCET